MTGLSSGPVSHVALPPQCVSLESRERVIHLCIPTASTILGINSVCTLKLLKIVIKHDERAIFSRLPCDCFWLPESFLNPLLRWRLTGERLFPSYMAITLINNLATGFEQSFLVDLGHWLLSLLCFLRREAAQVLHVEHRPRLLLFSWLHFQAAVTLDLFGPQFPRL